MHITEVRVRRVETNGRTKGIASITIDGDFVVKDIKVVEGPNGLFIAMPSRRNYNGTYRDVAHPITSEARELLREAILSEYEKR